MLKVLVLFLVTVLCGCIPVVGNVIPVSELRYEALQIAPLPGAGAGYAVDIHHFDDNRRSPYLLNLGTRRLRGDAAPAQLLASSLKDIFASQGYSVSGGRGPVISGEILEWDVIREGSYTIDTANARARFKITVNDSSLNPTFTSIYSGQAQEKSPILGEGHFSDALKAAMTEAILAAASDRRLHAAIQSHFEVDVPDQDVLY